MRFGYTCNDGEALGNMRRFLKLINNQILNDSIEYHINKIDDRFYSLLLYKYFFF